MRQERPGFKLQSDAYPIDPMRARCEPPNSALMRGVLVSLQPRPVSSRSVARGGVRGSVWLVVFALLCGNACTAGEEQGVFPIEHEEELRELPSDPPPKLRRGDLRADKDGLTFAATPYLGEEGTRRAFEPIAAAASEALGVPVRFLVSKSYAELIERTAAGEVDIVQLSPLSYVLARSRVPGLQLIASSLSFGTDAYSAFLVVRGDSEIHDLQDLHPERRRRGWKPRLALVDERSGSGFLLPFAALLDHDIDPQRDLDVVFTGSHEAAVEAVLAGDADMAGVSSGTLNSVRRGEVIGPGNLRIVFKAGRLPYDALCVAPGLSEEVARRIRSAFAGLDTRNARGRAALRNARGLTGWVATDDDRYDVLRTTLERVRTRRWSAWARDLEPSAAGVPDQASKTQSGASGVRRAD